MKFATVAAAAFMATAAAQEPALFEELVESKSSFLRAGKADQTLVKNGMMDDNHCEELYIPAKQYKQFWSDQGYKYPTYTDGICPVPYTTYDSKDADATYPEVTHVKRGVGSTAASITFENCGSGDFTFTAPTPTKGSTVTITGSGDLTGVTSGTYLIKADYGSISLVDKSESLADDMSVNIKVLLTDFGTLTATPPALPGTTDSKIEINMPVPNIGGTVTGTTQGMNQEGILVWCMKMTLSL